MSQSKYILAYILLSFLLCISAQSAVDNTPFIGIVTLPAEDGWDGYDPTQLNYFSASYVKFLESAGAQVIPVAWDLPTDQLDSLLSQLNGVLFTGGGSNLTDPTSGAPTPLWFALQHIVDYVLEQNVNGNFYPMWGTCMGFQVISMALANNISLLTACNGCIYVNKNNYPVSSYSSKILHDLPYDLQQKITTDNLSLFDHNWMVAADAFSQNPTLAGNVTPVAISYDASQTPYISMYESPKYPIYATQFHQEKSTFEWKPTYPTVHNFDSIRFEQYLANFFVNEARKVTNRSFPQNLTYIIDNYNATQIASSSFMEVYLFPALNPSHSLEYAYEEKVNHISESVSVSVEENDGSSLSILLDVKNRAINKEELFEMLDGIQRGFLERRRQ